MSTTLPSTSCLSLASPSLSAFYVLNKEELETTLSPTALFPIFIDFHLLERATESERESLPLLVHFPDAHGSQGWARLKSSTGCHAGSYCCSLQGCVNSKKDRQSNSSV